MVFRIGEEKNPDYITQNGHLETKKPSIFGPNLPFLKIYTKIKFFRFKSWSYLIYNPYHFLTFFESYEVYYHWPEGWGLQRYKENFCHTPTFWGLRIRVFRAPNPIFTKNNPRHLIL